MKWRPPLYYLPSKSVEHRAAQVGRLVSSQAAFALVSLHAHAPHPQRSRAIFVLFSHFFVDGSLATLAGASSTRWR
eukprot:3512684-Pyramimonas_sp.AAC.1